MNRPGPDEMRSAFKARGDVREYNVYIQTAAVEDAWPDMADWPLGPQVGPLLVSLEVALKILDETLDEAGTRAYVNDAAKAEVVAASVGAVLTLVADLASGRDRPADAPEGLFGPPSRGSVWSRVLKKLDRVGGGARLAADLRSGTTSRFARWASTWGWRGRGASAASTTTGGCGPTKPIGSTPRTAGSATSRIRSSSACIRCARAFWKRCWWS